MLSAPGVVHEELRLQAVAEYNPQDLFDECKRRPMAALFGVDVIWCAARVETSGACLRQWQPQWQLHSLAVRGVARSGEWPGRIVHRRRRYDQDGVYDQVAARHRKACVIVPPPSSAVPSATAETAPTMRDHHLHVIAERGRMAWQKTSGYHWRALVEADISRFKRVMGDGLRSRTDRRRGAEISVAVNVLNRMLELGCPDYIRIV